VHLSPCLVTFTVVVGVVYLDIVTRLDSGRPGDLNVIPCRCRNISLFHSIPARFGSHQIPFSEGIPGSKW
jgi:hypothetical protein